MMLTNENRNGSQEDEPVDYSSIDSFNDIESHFKRMCDIYIHAKRCFTYAHAIESQSDASMLKVIEDSELVQTFRYACSRLALIEALKLLKKNDQFSLDRFTKKILENNVRIRDTVKYQEICDELSTLHGRCATLFALRDRVFAHNDTPKRVTDSGAANVRYQHVDQLLKDIFKMLDDLQRVIPGLAPYHQPLPAVNAEEEVFSVLKYLSVQHQ